jgi:hypothetical protein
VHRPSCWGERHRRALARRDARRPGAGREAAPAGGEQRRPQVERGLGEPAEQPLEGRPGDLAAHRGGQ